MFTKLNQLACAAAVGLAVFTASSGAASAMPITAGPQTISPETVPVQYFQNGRMHGNMYWQSRRDGNRCRTRFGNCRHYYQGYYYETPWWTFPLIIGNVIANSNHGRSHLQWCLSRYRSYNPRTDMWFGSSGRKYRCNSPY
jgi:hypothetical protein